jgi:hypothetical protein
LVAAPFPGAKPAHRTLLYQSDNLEDYSIVAECNPGGTTHCPCGHSDVKVKMFENYGEVTANVRGTYTFVNAIANHKFNEAFSPHRPITPAIYEYEGQVQLPSVPLPRFDHFYAPQAIHIMMQSWDWHTSLDSHEAVLYWHVNPWTPDFGHLSVYTGQPPQLLDTGLSITPDTNWHSFKLVANFLTDHYVSATIDGQTLPVTAPLAQVFHPDWQPEQTFTLTAESENAWPGGPTCPQPFGWTTRFKSMKFWKQDPPPCLCAAIN